MAGGSQPTAEQLKALETSLQGVDLEAAAKQIQANPALAGRLAEIARRLPGGLAAGNFNCVCGASRLPGAEVVNPGNR